MSIMISEISHQAPHHMSVQLSIAHLLWPLIAENKDYRGFFVLFSSLVSAKSTKIYK